MPKTWTNLILAGVLAAAAGIAFIRTNAKQAEAAASTAVRPAAAETKPAPATPIDAKKAELGGSTWNPDWDHFIEQSIPPEMLSSACLTTSGSCVLTFML